MVSFLKALPFGVRGKVALAFILTPAWNCIADHSDSTEVRTLPDLDGVLPERSLFAGYLNVSRRHYYYVFARAQSDPDNAPFFFWTNGGPGCSSVGEGLWMEHGPYKVNGRLVGVEPNPYSWNRFANVLYLEHPVGVGFSYSENASDYKLLNDYQEADDLHDALEAFSALYPSFAPNKRAGLYLSGESYGGEYVPHLAHRIMTGHSHLLKSTLKGIIIANPALSCAADASGRSATLQYQMYFYHGLMSFEQFSKWSANRCDQGALALEEPCQQLLMEAEEAIGTVNQQLHKTKRSHQWRKMHRTVNDKSIEANFDPDHKYQSFCIANSTLDFATQQNANSPGCHPLGDPGRMSDYLNRRDVQQALHVRVDKLVSPQWTDCAGDWIHYTKSNANVLTSYFEPLFNLTDPTQFRVLIMSGDEDIGTCPGVITQACLSELAGHVKRTSTWRPWMHNGITAGYYEQFDRYTYATVKGAGHTVPQYQPLTSFQLITRWLANVSLNDTVVQVPPADGELDSGEHMLI
eukprot:TRINITY_DN11876_c0_g2_i1.p1 TRINITY_DN11876_c0_g2~~TRINITY_DN11876_c0_g2_i1.p1  ORF type:complete len:539 (-),score=37.56 TRINITY_DN11876_c0_g2_i1:357-1919(-)